MNDLKRDILRPIRLLYQAFISFCLWQLLTVASVASDEILRAVYMPDTETARWVAGWIALLLWWAMWIEIALALTCVPIAVQALRQPPPKITSGGGRPTR